MSDERLWRLSLELSDRHRKKWGDDCPVGDLDKLMAEFNNGIPVAVIDYKHHMADLAKTSHKTYEMLGNFHDPDGRQLPFLIARYWPGSWAFRVKPVNVAAVAFFERVKPGHLDGCGEWVPLTERAFVWLLYRLRKDTLDLRDRLYLKHLNEEEPPPEEGAA